LAETYREDLIHQIDLLRMFCGESTPIVTTSNHVDGNLLSSVSNLKNNTHGLGVILHSRESGLWQERVTIIGNEKTLQINLFQSVVEINTEGNKPIWISQSINPQLDDKGFQEEINHFLICINTASNPLTNGFEAGKSQHLQEQLVALNQS
jgi:virulence factor